MMRAPCTTSTWEFTRRQFPGRGATLPSVSLSVLRHESELDAWELVSRAPDPRLREHVARLCGYREEGPLPVRRRELPSTSIVVVLGFGPAIDVSDPAAGGAMVRRTSFVAGLDPRHSTTRHDGSQLGLQVDLTPLGAFALFGAPPGELAGRVLDLEEVLGRRGSLLVERLHEAPGWMRASSSSSEPSGSVSRRDSPPRRTSPGPGAASGRPTAGSRSARSPASSAAAAAT
jgi:hypothetical protein